MGKKKELVYAFIDSQNLNLGVKSLGWELDFARFRIYLKDKYKVKKTFLFVGYIPKYKKMYDYLKKAGYHIIFKPVLESKRKLKPKGNVDAELVLHSMIEYPNYDQAIIISGDGDFYCLVEYLSKQKKLARVIIPNYHRYSALLRKFINSLSKSFNLLMDFSLLISNSGLKLFSEKLIFPVLIPFKYASSDLIRCLICIPNVPSSLCGLHVIFSLGILSKNSSVFPLILTQSFSKSFIFIFIL